MGLKMVGFHAKGQKSPPTHDQLKADDNASTYQYHHIYLLCKKIIGTEKTKKVKNKLKATGRRKTAVELSTQLLLEKNTKKLLFYDIQLKVYGFDTHTFVHNASTYIPMR